MGSGTVRHIPADLGVNRRQLGCAGFFSLLPAGISVNSFGMAHFMQTCDPSCPGDVANG